MNNEPKFTPGPWYVYDTRERSEYAYDYYITAWQYFVAAVSPNSLDIQEANANLIAAAPEMYALLEDIAKNYQCMPNPATVENRINALLAKARGEANGNGKLD